MIDIRKGLKPVYSFIRTPFSLVFFGFWGYTTALVGYHEVYDTDSMWKYKKGVIVVVSFVGALLLGLVFLPGQQGEGFFFGHVDEWTASSGHGFRVQDFAKGIGYSAIALALEGRPCDIDEDGRWSIGLFAGPSPLNLTPIESWSPRYDDGRSRAWPVSNPVLTCQHLMANLKLHSSSAYVSDPFMYSPGTEVVHKAASHAEGREEEEAEEWVSTESDVRLHNNKIADAIPKPLYLFFATKNAIRGKGEIGVARSDSSGSSWKYLGIALAEDWYLSYPFIFEWNGDVYMLPEASKSGKLTLYKAIEFPLEWEAVSVLLDSPVVNPSIVQWEGLWYLFVTDDTSKGRKMSGSASAIELHVYHAETPLGPWSSHFLNPVMVGNEGSGARMAGRVVLQGDKLYRFGQDCAGVYGRDVLAFRIDSLSPGDFVQKRVKFQAGRVRKGAGAWNSLRRHHVDVIQLADGSWLGALDGDYSAPTTISRPNRYKLYILVCSAALAVFARNLIYGTRRHMNAIDSTSHSVRIQLRRTRSKEISEGKLYNQARKLYRSLRLTLWKLGSMFQSTRIDFADPFSSKTKDLKSRKSRSKLVADRFIGAAIMVGIVYGTFVLIVWTCHRQYYGSILSRNVEPHLSRLIVNGTFSTYTVVIEKIDSRVHMRKSDAEKILYTQIKNYGKCPSTAEVLVNHSPKDKGAMEYFQKKFPYYRPLAVNNSRLYDINYKVTTRAVVVIKAGMMLPCSDVEAAFAAWRLQPHAMYGITPGYAERFQNSRIVLWDDRITHRKKQFNLLLSGMLLVDFDKIPSLVKGLPEYQSIDSIINQHGACDDVIVSFAWRRYINQENSRATEGSGTKQALINMRPKRAMDLFYKPRIEQSLVETRNKCIKEFLEKDESLSKGEQDPFHLARRWWSPLCALPGGGCVYL